MENTPVNPPASRAELPPLSPPFVTPDDAARWAHERIARHSRDREYGGAIFKRGGRFYATEPVPDQHVMFDHTLILPTDKNGDFVLPEGYMGEAYYHSHPLDPDEVARQNPGMTGSQVVIFQSLFSIPDMRFIVEHRKTARAHYLSGPNGSLLKYVSSDSTQEQTLYQQWTGKLPIEQSSVFENLIWLLAEAGELRVIEPIAEWGGVRGKVTRAWKVGKPVALPGTVREQPAFTQVFGRAELAVLSALANAPTAVPARTMGVVLKHTQSDGYVATYPQATGQPLFALDGLFPKRPDGKPRFPSQWRLEAIYYTSRPDETAFPKREPWLYAHFFTPAEMVAAIIQSRLTAGIQDKARGLALYMKAEDGALLRFKLPGGAEHTRLALVQSDGVLNDNGAQAALLAGTLTPREYVRRVLVAGDLSVVQPGELWRYEGRVDDRSTLLTSFYEVALSRSFLSAVDAAVHAHEQIGHRRDRYYGGYVLKGEDGRFVITEPLEGDANPFDKPLFFPAGGKGPLIPPELYQLHGRYGSHPALSMVDPAWVEQRGWTRDDAMINMQAFADDEIREVIRQKRVAFLSGGRDCLLAYTPSQTLVEQLLLQNVAPRAGGSRIREQMANGVITPAQWVIHLAEAGEIKVIEGSRLWGPRSVLHSDWSPNLPDAPRVGAPDYATFGAVFGSADEAARNLHARVHGRSLAHQSCFSFILRHPKSDEFVASQVVGVSARYALFNLNSVFASSEKPGDFRFPEGFVLHALFRSQQWQPTGLGAADSWLARYFVQPGDLYAALYDAKRRGEKYNAGQYLPIYFSTDEGALLRYVSLPFQLGGGGPLERNLEDTIAQLNSGAKTPVEFVRETAKRGQLTVLRTSQYWDKEGLVSPDWNGYSAMTRRRLGPTFASADDAARHAQALVGTVRQRAYGGVVLRLANGAFTATDPLAVPPQGFARNWIYPDEAISQGLYPGGASIVARYRSRLDVEVELLLAAAQKAVYKSMLPSAVLAYLLLHETQVKREYLFGPDGSILSYQRTDSAEEAALRSRLAPLNAVRGDYTDNLVEQQIRQGTLLPTEFVTEVAKAGDLRVISGSVLWGPARLLVDTFVWNVEQPPAREIRQALADPPCSPLYTRAIDAVRALQLGSTTPAQLTFGYVLKSAKKQRYMATAPLARESFVKLEQVWVAGQLPQGYVWDGLYLQAPTVQASSLEGEMAKHFFWPQEVVNALSAAKRFGNGRVLTLYLMCADGALLQYDFERSALLFEMLNQAPRLRASLLDGSLKMQDYVRSLAARGDMQVWVRSPIWASVGKVGLDWSPKVVTGHSGSGPYAHLFCDALYFYADDAARSAQKRVGRFNGIEYLGAVLVPPDESGFVALEPVEDRSLPFPGSLARLFRLAGFGLNLTNAYALYFYNIAAIQAFYKVIPSTTSLEAKDLRLLKRFASLDDWRRYVSIVRTNLPVAESCYLVCREGALLKYVPGHTQEESALLGPGLAPDPSVLVERMRRVGNLSVLETDDFWTRRGVLGPEWPHNGVQSLPDTDDMLYGRDKDEL
ncbi:DUF4329 domain-containing protein [Pseudomonas marginalis]